MGRQWRGLVAPHGQLVVGVGVGFLLMLLTFAARRRCGLAFDLRGLFPAGLVDAGVLRFLPRLNRLLVRHYLPPFGLRPPNAAAATLLTAGDVLLLRSSLLALRATLSEVLGFDLLAIVFTLSDRPLEPWK